MRTLDDIADSHRSNSEKKTQLNRFFEQTNQSFIEAVDGTFWPAFKNTIQQYDIQIHCLTDMYQRQSRAIAEQTFSDFDDLYRYCYDVASTVGLICLAIWGYSGGHATEKLAEYRGIAFQLTNILRDLHADAMQGIVYIPNNWFHQKNDVLSDVLSAKPSDDLMQTIQRLIMQAEKYYQKSACLEQYISCDGQLSLKVMTQYYYALFQKIKQHPNAYLHKKITLDTITKIKIVLCCMLR